MMILLQATTIIAFVLMVGILVYVGIASYFADKNKEIQEDQRTSPQSQGRAKRK